MEKELSNPAFVPSVWLVSDLLPARTKPPDRKTAPGYGLLQGGSNRLEKQVLPVYEPAGGWHRGTSASAMLRSRMGLIFFPECVGAPFRIPRTYATGVRL